MLKVACIRKIKGFILDPLRTINACKNETLDEAMECYKYFMAIISVIIALFFVMNSNEIYSFLGSGTLGITARIGLGFIIGLIVYVFSIIGIWMEGAFIHIGVYLLGGKKGINQTVKAAIYSTYIWILLALIFGFLEQIPYINKIPIISEFSEVILVILPLALTILGVQRFHEITTLRAIIGVSFIPIIIPVFFGIVLAELMPEEYKDSSNEDQIMSIEPTSDGSYILSGSIKSSGTGIDALLIKIDVNGSEQMNKTFGGAGRDIANSAMQTLDGGYILVGETESYGEGVDGWLIKIDANGNEQWNKTFGGKDSDWMFSAEQTSDGGFVLTGYTESFGKGGDGWLIKTDANGNERWRKTFGRDNSDWIFSVEQTSDDGFILAGKTESSGAGKSDGWLIKTDVNGNLDWERTFGGEEDDAVYSFKPTKDGGYVLIGDTVSYGGGYDSYNDQYLSNVWLIKTDSNGNLQWNRTFGGFFNDAGRSVQQTSDDGFILAGGKGSFSDAWIIKTDANGYEQWNKTYGGFYWETAYSIQTKDDSYIFGGHSLYFSSEGGAWLAKTDAYGNLLWTKMFGERYLKKSFELVKRPY